MEVGRLVPPNTVMHNKIAILYFSVIFWIKNPTYSYVFYHTLPLFVICVCRVVLGNSSERVSQVAEKTILRRPSLKSRIE